MQLIRTPRGSSTADALTKPSTKWFIVVPMVAAVHVFIGQDARYEGERPLVGDERERRPDQVDLAHPLGLDRVRPLLVGGLFERPRKHVSCGVRHGIEGSDAGEESFQALRVGNVRLEVAGLAPYRHDLVSILFQRLFHCGPDGPASDNDSFHDDLLKIGGCRIARGR